MSEAMKVTDLPEFDGAPYLNNEISIAAYLADILEADDEALLTAAQIDITRARRMMESLKSFRYDEPSS